MQPNGLIAMAIAAATRHDCASTHFVVDILQLILQKLVYGGEALAERIGQRIASLALGSARSSGRSDTKILNIVGQTF
jgi:hypothetical protein